MVEEAPVSDSNKMDEDGINKLSVADLRRLTNEMVDKMLAYISDATDEDVIFEPDDPDAHDPYAENEGDVDLAWTLGHVIVHTTASAEEAAALAAEMARGVSPHGRSRSEVPWESVTTIQQCRDRLEESRRMRLASLEMWPDKPNLEFKKFSRPNAPKINAVSRFIKGLAHDESHLEQIQTIVQQAKSART